METEIQTMQAEQLTLIKQFAELMTDCIFIMEVRHQHGNPVFTYEYMNIAGRELARLSANDIGKSFQESCFLSQAEFLQEKYTQVLETNGIIKYADNVVLPNGQFKAETKLIPIYDSNDNITYILGITINLTHLSMKTNDIKYLDRLFNLFIENIDESLALVDMEGNFLMANHSFYQLLNLKKSQLADLHFTKFQPHLSEELSAYLEGLSAGLEVGRKEMLFYDNEEIPINVIINLSSIPDETGKSVAFALIIENITDKIETNQKLSEATEKYQLIAENMQDLIKIIDSETRIKYASPSHFTVAGYKADDLIGKMCLDFVYEKDKENVILQYQKLSLNKKNITFEFRMVRKDGEIMWMEDNVKPIFDDQGKIRKIITSSRDISKRKAAEQKLKKMAYTDYLTGLPNRRVFEDLGQQAFSAILKDTEKMAAILYLDGDKFKEINDCYGHGVGDQFLIAVADRLKKNCKSQQVISRIGGDEFAILLASIESVEEIEFQAKEILETMRIPFKVGDQDFHLSFSIGASVFPKDGENFKKIMKNADQALYQAKNQGRNRFVLFNL